MYKHAALSPAIQALQQMPTAEAAKQSFEQQLGEQAYSTFQVKFPDLVESIVTFKTLDSDPDTGTAFGAFILDIAGEAIYVPVVFADSVISPIEIMYVKSKDMFVPLSQEWIAETMRSADQAMGAPAKLPDTVPTDVDIRNLVVPPTTGRYSYASTGKFATEAAWTTPAGKQITKRANEQFDPVMWEGFIEQFARMNGVTPGMALDQGQMGIDELAKLYKSHAKTWGPQAAPAPAGGTMQPQPAAAPAAPAAPAPAPAQPQTGVASNAMPSAQPPQMYPKTAMSIPAAQGGKGFFQAVAPTADDVAGTLLESGALGALLGGGTAAYEGDYRNLASRAAAGGLGGAAFGGAGKMMGHGLNARHPKLTGGHADEIGQALGTIGGGISASLPDAPPQDQYRFASDLTPMMKHAFAKPRARERRLIPYLHAAPNTVKTAFLHVLREHPMLMKFAAETYGADALIAALRAKPTAVKTAGRTEYAAGLRVAKTNAATKAFGKRSPLAFRGVQLRGYYYEDVKKPKNRAVLKQEYHDAHDIREPGIFNLWKTDGTRAPVFALVNPISIFNDDRPTYPRDSVGLTKVERYAPGTFDTHPEPGSTASTSHPAPDVERSHRVKHLLVFKDGKYTRPSIVHGEQLTESAMEGGKIYGPLFTDKGAPPKAGDGFFVYKTGAHYYGTEPLRLKSISTDSDGVITADICHVGGDWSAKKMRMDPKSPVSRIIRPRGEQTVYVPYCWRWVPLGECYDKDDLLLTASSVIDMGMNMLESTNVKVRNTADKAAAIKDLADTYDISGADAEAMLKIAELEGECRALIVSKDKLRETAKFASVIEQAFSDVMQGLGSAMENIQGQMQVLQQVQQRAQELAQDPNAMQSTDPGMAGAPTAEQPAEAPPAEGPPPAAPPQSGDPAAQAAPPPAPPQGAPAPAPGMDPGGAPADPSTAPGGAPMDPAAQGMDPAMAGGVDPATGQPMAPPQPPLPMMGSEGPSSMEIAQQVNPEFLEQAAAMQDAGIFDVSALSELDRAAGTSGVPNPAPLTENSRDLAETVDDLGRTLLMLQLRQVDLQEQLSGDTYKELEQQVRNTFQGLGKLMLDLHQHSSALSHVQDSNAA